MSRTAQSSSPNLSKYIAPAALGAGYAITKIVVLRWVNKDLAIMQDFKMFLIAGILLGFALRHIVQRIYWYRSTSFIVTAILLLGLGPFGKTLEQVTWGALFDNEYWNIMLPEIASVIFVAGLSPVLFTPKQFQVSLSELWRRTLKYFDGKGLLKIFFGAIVYLLLFLTFQSILSPHLTAATPLSRLYEFFELPPISPLNKCLLILGRGALCVVVLLPVCSVLHGKRTELTITLGALFFVVTEFTPAFANIGGIAPFLLTDQIMTGLFPSFMFCYVVVILFGKSYTFGPFKKIKP